VYLDEPRPGNRSRLAVAQSAPLGVEPAWRSTPLILVVDDMPDVRDVVAEYLEHRCYQVATAEDGLDGLDKAFELGPDLILMDLAMPRLDGWEATRRLKADPRTSHIPVIAFTGHVLKEYLDQAWSAGCQAVLTKPLQPRDLEAEVRRVLGRDPQPANRG
jgi:two-component system cell cycle response regulator DivK